MTKRPILVDTQLLVLLVVGSMRPSLIARHKRTKDLYTRVDFDLLLELLGYAPRFVFCPHVAAEVSNLVGQHGEPDRSSLMAILKAVLNNAQEVTISSARACQAAIEAKLQSKPVNRLVFLELGCVSNSMTHPKAMDGPEYLALGLADAAQLALCSPDTVLLTDDGPLFRAASTRGATALHFKDEKFKRRRFLV